MIVSESKEKSRICQLLQSDVVWSLGFYDCRAYSMG